MMSAGVGRLEYLDTLSSLGHAFQLNTVATHLKDYGAWRRCQADGNSFYRAFGFALIEGIVRKKPHRLKNIVEEITGSSHRQAQVLVEFLQALERMDTQVATMQWYSRFFTDPEMDAQLVQAVRLAAANFLDQNREADYDGLPIGIWCESASGMELDAFIQNSLLVTGQEANNFHITIVAMAFGKIIEVIQPNQQWESYTVPADMPGESSHPTVTLMARILEGTTTTEFDILYRTEPHRGETPLQGLFQCEAQAGVDDGDAALHAQSATAASSSSDHRRRRDPNDYSAGSGGGLAQQLDRISQRLGDSEQPGSIDALSQTLKQAARSTEKAMAQNLQKVDAEINRMEQERQHLQAKQREIEELQASLEEKEKRLAKETEEVNQLHERVEQLRERSKSGGFLSSLPCCAFQEQKKSEVREPEEDPPF